MVVRPMNDGQFEMHTFHASHVHPLVTQGEGSFYDLLGTSVLFTGPIFVNMVELLLVL